jgi:hypothetical protein
MPNLKSQRVERYRGGSAPKRHSTDALAPLLYTRSQAARLLSCSTATLVRLEQSGRLTPRKLYGQSTGRTYYLRDDLVALAQGGDDD